MSGSFPLPVAAFPPVRLTPHTPGKPDLCPVHEKRQKRENRFNSAPAFWLPFSETEARNPAVKELAYH
jgi:hypothetical protein